ncbi:MAG: diguanylate cyclase [Thiohalomonadaceae bacterium]|jgi:diguanylate cyclase (GGDEF)-like protein/PAS domain S-box-containing protein
MKNWLIRLQTWQLIIVTVTLAVLLSEGLVILFGYFLYAEVRTDHLLIGLLTALTVSLIMVIIIKAIARSLQYIDEQLLERSLYLDSILHSTADTLIIALDNDFRIKYLNSVAAHALNAPIHEVNGRPLLELIDEGQRELFAVAMQSMRTGIEYAFECEFEINDLSHSFDASLSEIVHHQQLAGFLLLAHDATERKRMEKTLRELSYLDGLTGIANRRRFDEVMDIEWRRAVRDKQPIALIMIDIDLFKNYNDFYGHLAGDECLRKIAQVLQDSITRPGDLVARYGGEEFAAILPNTSLPGAEILAEEIRAAVERQELPHEKSSVSPWVTISAGIADWLPTNSDEYTLLVAKADRAMYKAKQSGRNRIFADNHH